MPEIVMPKWPKWPKWPVLRSMVLSGSVVACWGLPVLASAAGLPLVEALRMALAKNPDILVQAEQVMVARGQAQQADGQFDWLTLAGASYDRTITPLPPSSDTPEIRQQASSYQVGVNKQLRNGSVLASEVRATTTQSLSTPGNAGTAQQNLVNLKVSLTVPLLKGRGGAVVTAAKDVAVLNVLRSRYDLRNQVSQTLLNVLLAYWDYRTRVALLKVAQTSEQRSQDLLVSNQKLVDAAEKPRGDLVLLKADQTDKLIALEAAQLAMTESRKVLGRLLGLDLAAITELGEPADPFPPVSASIEEVVRKIAPIINNAQQQRPDLKSLSLQVEAAQRQLRLAQERVKPQLDFSAGVSVGRASENGSRLGFIAEPGRTQSAPSISTSLNYQFPLENNQANGGLKEISALLLQLEIRQADLGIGIATGVDSALQTLLRTRERLIAAQAGLSLFEQLVNQEIIKQRNGIATLIDVVNVEDRYVSAQVNFLQLQLAWANALARLRFETGTLVPAQAISATEPDAFELDVADLSGLGRFVLP